MNKKKNLWTSEEHELLRRLKPLHLKDKHLLLAISGGRDSMLLLQVMVRLQKALGFSCSAIHVHHGGPPRRKQTQFRDQARDLVCRTGERLGVPVHVVKYSGVKKLESEEELRAFREEAYLQTLSECERLSGKRGLVVTAHHNADLVETQMLRLIRGTGLQGLEAMSFQQKDRLRPLIDWTEEQLARHVRLLRVRFVEDPSNKSENYLRNWMRHKWLAQLEKQVHGGVRNLGRSLQNILEQSQDREWSKYFDGNSLRLTLFWGLTSEEKQSLLAFYLRQLDIRDYGRSHIMEILKRLDNSRKEFNFTLLKHEWYVNAQHITARPRK